MSSMRRLNDAMFTVTSSFRSPFIAWKIITLFVYCTRNREIGYTAVTAVHDEWFSAVDEDEGSRVYTRVTNKGWRRTWRRRREYSDGGTRARSPGVCVSNKLTYRAKDHFTTFFLFLFYFLTIHPLHNAYT